ncbi:Metallophosphoesterase [hydrothermal vent metagenome]|uniref:Metallophosphoesterase n=1 Tax=hydrothermal vent metagenome TaxID=652676 RepID=A0A3B0V644_9ZZZZ
MKILLLSDIHGNSPALEAVAAQTAGTVFDLICNCGDSTVYAPFPNETLDWLRRHHALSILGNTDIKVLKLLKGETFKKPSTEEKRVMYTWTADHLTSGNKKFLKEFTKTLKLEVAGHRLGLFHGSPAHHNEFLFQETPINRFHELAGKSDCGIVISGHSHSPYHKKVNHVHFINPGSVGRMFDGCPDSSYAVLELTAEGIRVEHFRCPYDIDRVISALKENHLPSIYEKMYRLGRKLN